MPEKRFGAELIVTLLRQIEELMAQGKATQISYREEGISEQLRDELFNCEIFYSLQEAKFIIERWRRHYKAVGRIGR